jgi:hypothetical protein
VVIVMSRTSAAVALGALVPLSLIPDGGFLTGSVMGITTDFMGFLRGLSITTILALVVWMIWKFEIICLISVQEGTVAIRTSWGRPRFHRTNRQERKGRLLVLHPGRHLIVKGLHGLVVVNLRVDVLQMPTQKMTVKGRTFIREGMLFDWRIPYEDSFEGDLRLLNRVWFLADGNVHDASIANYRQKLVGVLEKALSEALLTTDPRESDLFPSFRLPVIRELVAQSEQQSRIWVTGDGRQLLEENKKRFIFPELVDMTVPVMAYTDAQTEADAEIEAAKIKAEAAIETAKIEAEAKITSARILAGQPEEVLTEESAMGSEESDESPIETQPPRLHLAGTSDLIGAR